MLTLLLIYILFQIFASSYGCMSMAPAPDTSFARANNHNSPEEPDPSDQAQQSQPSPRSPARDTGVLESPVQGRGSQAIAHSSGRHAVAEQPSKSQRSQALKPSPNVNPNGIKPADLSRRPQTSVRSVVQDPNLAASPHKGQRPEASAHSYNRYPNKARPSIRGEQSQTPTVTPLTPRSTVKNTAVTKPALQSRQPQSDAHLFTKDPDLAPGIPGRSQRTEAPIQSSTWNPNTVRSPAPGERTAAVGPSPTKSAVRGSQKLARLFTRSPDLGDTLGRGKGSEASAHTSTWNPVTPRPLAFGRGLQPSTMTSPAPLSTTQGGLPPAKVFRIPPLKPVEVPSNQILEPKVRVSTRELRDSEEASGQELPIINPVEVIHIPDNSIDDDLQYTCEACPALLMTDSDAGFEDEHFCSNWKSIQESFNIVVSPELPTIHDQDSTDECTRTVKCGQPYVLVRWYNSTICDVHSLSYHLDTSSTSFSYNCNGTSWSMHNFPIDSVACATKLFP